MIEKKPITMHVLLLQFYYPLPPDYPEMAHIMRGHGHVVWIGTPGQDQSIQWHDGKEIIAVQNSHYEKAQGTIGRRLAKYRLFRDVRRFIRETEPDIVQIDAHNLFRLMPLGMPGKTKFIHDMRQINEVYGTGIIGQALAGLRNKSRLIDSRFSFDRTTFLHEAGAQKVLGNEWRRWATVVPLATSEPFLNAERSQDYGGMSDRPVRFIYIGSLGRVRRLERIIEAADLMCRQTDQFCITLLGSDRSDGFYPDLIRRLKLDDLVTIHPSVPHNQVPQAILAHDVALAYVPEVPLDWQYHPTMKIIEYRALGIPIIASDFLPNRELVEHGVTGLLAQNSAESLAEAMLRYVNDRALLQDNYEDARNRRHGLTWPEVSQQYINLYQQLLDN
ncbi:MAG: glycosyltransferase family 4 protein [Candidatus Promineofilum sp.]|nr:glycosyltransferase family 4 protein [Promineifilum sp.]MBP9656603.1 glycosyltransferase family 4 protein [Promineifilum sp.]